MITKKYLKSRLNYNSKTGIFTWKTVMKHSNRRIGDIAGTLDNHGYIKIKIYRTIYPAHRLAFLYMTGFVPEFVDHKDRNKSNNKWNNLREATRSQNAANKGKNKDCTNRYKGITHFNNTTKKKWTAQIKVNEKHIHIGCFKTQKEAARAYDKKALELFGKFAKLNFKRNE